MRRTVRLLWFRVLCKQRPTIWVGIWPRGLVAAATPITGHNAAATALPVHAKAAIHVSGLRPRAPPPLCPPPPAAAASTSMAAASTVTGSASSATDVGGEGIRAAREGLEEEPPPVVVEQEELAIVDSTPERLGEIRGIIMNSDYTDVFEKPLVDLAANQSMMVDWLLGPRVEQLPMTGKMVSKSAYATRGGKPFLYTGKSASRTGRNCYLVKLKPNLGPETISKIRHILGIAGGKIKHDYNFGLFAGYAVCFPENLLPISLLRAIVGIAHVERDQYSRVKYVQEDAPWQLARMNSQKAEISTNNRYMFNSTGQGVNVYVIDSGVMVDHPEFGGRAKIGHSVFTDFPNDCAGHGTQVSSVIAGTNVGMAKLASIVAVQVLDCDGQGENSAVMAALNWIVANHQKPAVINMSVGGPKSPTVDDAVRAAVDKGLGVVVAAGNSMIDACSLSPSGVHAALVVGASTADQERAKFSNFGPCVDIFAPGRHIVAAAVPNQATKNGFTFVSGTSLSAPLVTGIYALLLESNPDLSPTQLKAAVLQLGARDILSLSTLYGSPNLLAQTPSLPSTPGVSITFLPVGTLPAFGLSTANSELELIMIIVAACFAGLFVLAIFIVLIRRCRRAAKERPSPKFPQPSSFQ